MKLTTMLAGLSLGLALTAAQADLTVGVDAHRAIPGTWVRMPADTRHSLPARTAVVMALYLLPREVAATS